jgi:hypothetical protein
MPGVNMDDLVEMFHQIRDQSIQPNTMIMHPDVWEQISRPAQPVRFKIADIRPWQPVAIGPDGWPVIEEQQMTAPTRLQEYMDFKFKEPPVYKDRWQSIMEEEL